MNCPEGQSLNLIDALDTKHPGNSLHVLKYALQLVAIGNVDGGFNARLQIVRSAVEHLNVGSYAADHAGNICEKSGTILAVHHQRDGIGSLPDIAPLYVDAAFGLIEQLLDVGTRGVMHGDSAAPCDIADDGVARNRITTFGAVNHEIVLAKNQNGGISDPEHSLH